jgi:hypothetical protein
MPRSSCRAAVRAASATRSAGPARERAPAGATLHAWARARVDLVKHVDDSVVGAGAFEVLLEERVDARLEDLPRAARRSAPRALSAPTAPVAGGLWVQPFGCRAPGPAGRTRPSLIAFCFTSAFLYQHGCPRRVMESSMMSSSTRKHACSHSMHHPTTYRPPAGPLRPAPPCPPAQRAPAPRRQAGPRIRRLEPRASSRGKRSPPAQPREARQE